MAYTKTDWKNLPNTTTPINATNLNKIENGIADRVKTRDFTLSVTPNTLRGSAGFGETTLNISSLNASKILAITFYSSSNYMLWGIESNLSTLESLTIYGYRISGTYSNTVSTNIRIIYE